MNRRPGEGLDHQLARLSLVLENAPVILYGLDREGRFMFSEADGISAMGLKKGQIVGNSASVTLPEPRGPSSRSERRER